MVASTTPLSRVRLWMRMWSLTIPLLPHLFQELYLQTPCALSLRWTMRFGRMSFPTRSASLSSALIISWFTIDLQEHTQSPKNMWRSFSEVCTRPGPSMVCWQLSKLPRSSRIKIAQTSLVSQALCHRTQTKSLTQIMFMYWEHWQISWKLLRQGTEPWTVCPFLLGLVIRNPHLALQPTLWLKRTPWNEWPSPQLSHS